MRLQPVTRSRGCLLPTPPYSAAPVKRRAPASVVGAFRLLGCLAVRPFDDGPASFRLAVQRGLKGVASKRRMAHSSGDCRDRRKLKAVAGAKRHEAMAIVRTRERSAWRLARSRQFSGPAIVDGVT